MRDFLAFVGGGFLAGVLIGLVWILVMPANAQTRPPATIVDRVPGVGPMGGAQIPQTILAGRQWIGPIPPGDTIPGLLSLRCESLSEKALAQIHEVVQPGWLPH